MIATIISTLFLLSFCSSLGTAVAWRILPLPRTFYNQKLFRFGTEILINFLKGASDLPLILAAVSCSSDHTLFVEVVIVLVQSNVSI